MTFEYKVVPAPTRGQKGKGVKGPEARFANALEQNLNTLAADGWEFMRAETLPSEERSGLTSTTTTYRTVLVYRRPVARTEIDDAETTEPAALPAPEETPKSDDASRPDMVSDAADTSDAASDTEVTESDTSEVNATEPDATETGPRDQDDVVRAGVDSLKQD